MSEPLRIIPPRFLWTNLSLNRSKIIPMMASECWPCALCCWGRPSQCGRSRHPPSRGCPVGCPGSDRWATAPFYWSGTTLCWSRPSKHAQFCRACSPWGPPPSLSSTSTWGSNKGTVMGTSIERNLIVRQKKENICWGILKDLLALTEAMTFYLAALKCTLLNRASSAAAPQRFSADLPTGKPGTLGPVNLLHCSRLSLWALAVYNTVQKLDTIPFAGIWLTLALTFHISFSFLFCKFHFLLPLLSEPDWLQALAEASALPVGSVWTHITLSLAIQRVCACLWARVPQERAQQVVSIKHIHTRQD